MALSSVAIVEPVVAPHRDASADYAGSWLASCVSSLGFVSFYLANFYSNVLINDGTRQTGRWVADVVFAGSVFALRCPFHCYTLINQLHISTA